MAVEQADTKSENTDDKTDNSKEIPADMDAGGNTEQTAAGVAAADQDDDPPVSGAAAGTEIDDVDVEALRQEIDNLRQQLDENTDKMLRVQAEMDNLHKRTRRDIENAHKFALDKFVPARLAPAKLICSS